ncbi:lipopolysaccharide biosynthesis protein [Nonomuraea dietziae]|uniref:O-antigen/teichoic acid export membrane protein n=1 Tax=Nonomuraea dietziae TaxID=65515 RepID=A0A7W5YDG3_9ACTN|nr:polysaccharide biosynthesis C-terminal domain-containing protein [Nonomuraea dietziae]MBB3730433.1 O-antigen/teichoic acid export membrane protein [Nonomuraea dietziae]
MTPARRATGSGGRLGRVARAGLAGVTGAGVSALAQFLLVVIVTRTFSAEQAGTFFTAVALALMVAGIAKLDAGNGLIFFVARAKTYDYRGISGYVRAAVTPGALLSTAAGVVLYPLLGPLALALPLMVVADILLAATRGFGSMRTTVLLDGMLLPVAQLVLVAVVAAAALPYPQEALAGAWAAPYLVVAALAALSLRRRVPRTPYLPGTARDLWRHTAPRSAASAIQALFQRLDIVIVALLAGPAQAAIYTAATRFKVVGQLASQGLAQAAQPRLVRALAEGDLPRARELYQVTTMWLVLLTWPVWLGYALLAPWLLRIFGTGYDEALPVALVLAGTMMVATACGMVDVVLISAGHTSASLANLVAAVAVTVLLDLALIPAHGALGAAMGWSGGVLVKNLLPLWQIHQRYGLRPFGRHSLTALRFRSWATA